MQISVNLQSGRFEKNLQTGGGGIFCMQISVNLQSGRFEKKSPKLGVRFLHADFSKSVEWQI